MAAMLLDDKPDDVEGYLVKYLEDGKEERREAAPPAPLPAAPAAPPPPKVLAPPAPKPPVPEEKDEEKTDVKDSSTRSSSPTLEKIIIIRKEGDTTEQYNTAAKRYEYVTNGVTSEERPESMEQGSKPVVLKKQGDWRSKWDYNKNKVFYSNVATKTTTWKVAETPFGQ
eukprot:TRINITY_DN11534_c0_g1_i1.p2 TRINITY_DN11534_c0_g1~~TRINITY_DN11534_c0_g1_i1.p2  ORF type:complete len:198 (+),score=58.83 TRINITY_DN11534_c0_g1_i1:89-595(+)